MPRLSNKQIAIHQLERREQLLRRSLLLEYALNSSGSSNGSTSSSCNSIGSDGASGGWFGNDDDNYSTESESENEDDDSICSVDSGYDADGGISDSDISDDDDDDDELMYFQTITYLHEVRSSRYYSRRNYRKSDNTVFEKHLDESEGCFLNEEEFKTTYRCSRNALDWIEEQIRGHDVFKVTRGRKQEPVIHQLMILLQFLGQESSSNRSQRGQYWKSYGFCEKARARCVEAILSLRDEYIVWPNENERKEISKRILKKYQIPNSVGIIDGTLLQLAFMPEADDKADYSGRKYQWSLSTMIVNDDKCKIRYYLAGFPGTSHDNRIWKRTKLHNKKEDYFSALEYLLGDSAFEPSDVMVSVYKKLPGVPLEYEENRLNDAVSKPRVRSEHTIGIWKGRFPWLRKIRKVITNDKQSIVDILKIIECCVILHNMLLEYGDESPEVWQDEPTSDIDDPDRAPDEDDAMNEPLPDGSPKDARRTTLKNYLASKYIYEGNDDTDSDYSYSY